MTKNLPRLFRTVRYLRPRQLAARIFGPFRFFYIGKPQTELRKPSKVLVEPIAKRQFMFGEAEFRILNQTLILHSRRSWNDRERDKLLLYHLHYHDDLTAVGATERLRWHEALIARWIDENPILIGNGWEPYPLSLRIVNWIKWHHATGRLDVVAKLALWVQSRILEQSIEYHLQANHLLTNAKALYWTGAFFSGTRASRWLRLGQRLLEKQIAVQVLDDGAHIERSPMYHAIILEDLLDVRNIAACYDLKPPQSLNAAIERMLRWQETMIHADDSLPHFNDSVAGIAPVASELRAYAERLGLAAAPAGPHASCMQDCSGYARLENRRMRALLDFGEVGPDYQPGHAHCDTLSFELSIDGRRTFVNRGISTYNVCALRHEERGTRSHNTVAIDVAEQSEIWSAFRVGRRARPINVEINGGRMAASHDGWAHLGIQHRRAFELNDHSLEIHDELQSDDATQGVASFHFHSDIDVTLNNDVVRFAGGQMHFTGAESVALEEYRYCTSFGDTTPSNVVRVAFTDRLETNISHAHPVHH